MVRPPQIRVEEHLERDESYRGDAGRAVLELTRPPFEPLPELPHWRGYGLLASSLVLASAPMFWAAFQPDQGGMHPALYGALGGLFAVVGVCALVLRAHALWQARRWRRDRERVQGEVRVRVDADGIHATPRSDERARWDGEVAASEVTQVFTEPAGAFHRVRVELTDGREVTLIDGVEEAEEAAEIAARVRAQLAHAAPRR